MRHLKTFCYALLLPMLLSGCTRNVMPTPNVYATSKQPLFGPLEPELTSNHVDVLYVTDRVAEEDEFGHLRYGYKRSPSVAYGSAIVVLGKDTSWEELSAYSRTKTGFGRRLPLKVVSTTERGRFPATPYLYRIAADTDIELDPEVVAEREETLSNAKREILGRLALTPRKEVFVFVHGIRTSFDVAVETAGEGWHFLGREGIPVAYTWPAGGPGLFSYARDRESGEFTHFHMKQFFRVLADIPEIEKVHVIAHSRGTDVAMTALRELVIEARAAGKDPREQYRIDNVVLVAPDVDFKVTLQRFVAEALGPAFGRITIYANADDNAIAAASALFSSRVRLGAVQPEELTQAQKEAFARVANLDVIVYQGRAGGAFGHTYYRDNPAVSSDILMVLRYGRPPGAATGRPLTPRGNNFWVIGDDYLL